MNRIEASRIEVVRNRRRGSPLEAPSVHDERSAEPISSQRGFDAMEPSAADRFLAMPWLADLDLESRAALLDVLVEDRRPAGEALAVQGLHNDKLSFVIEGKVTISRTYPDGRTERIADLTAPAVFGESAFFSGLPSVVTTRATTSVRRLTLDHDSYERLRRENPHAAEQLALAAVRVLSERFEILDRRVSELTLDHPKADELGRFRARMLEESLW